MFICPIQCAMYHYIKLGFGRIPDIQLIIYAGYPVLARYPADKRISGRITGYCDRIIIFLKIRLGYCVRPNDHLLVCPSVRPSIFNMYELLLTYYYGTKNLRNYAFSCLFKGIFIVKYKRLNCFISCPTGYPALPYIIY